MNNMKYTNKFLALISFLICISIQSCKKENNASEPVTPPISSNYKMSCKINGQQWHANIATGILSFDSVNVFRTLLLTSDENADTVLSIILEDTALSNNNINQGLYLYPPVFFGSIVLLDLLLVNGIDTMAAFDDYETSLNINDIDNANHIVKQATFSAKLYLPTTDTVYITDGIIKNFPFILQ